MIERAITNKIKATINTFPLVTLTGSRQCGKSTLLKYIFPDWKYVSFEDLDIREMASKDPRYFLSLYPEKAVFDEVQQVPELFPYIQTHVDKLNKPGIYILSGSQNFLLMEKISQSLAGRTALLTLAPFSIRELKPAGLLPQSLNEYIFKGSYPRIYDQNPDPVDFYPAYIKTYIERDVRLLRNITSLPDFHRFLKLCAGRCSQILNVTELSNQAELSLVTTRSWLSVLETSHIIFYLRPYHKNYGKRLIKSPKLYFYDTGLVANLLGLEKKEQLETHFMRGSLFENLIISEYMKKRFFEGKEPRAYYWRDSSGLEIDLVEETPEGLNLYEIKSSATVKQNFFGNIEKFQSLAGTQVNHRNIIYGGTETYPEKDTTGGFISWQDY